jgi:polysaccharide export outer membrane protein
MSDFFQLTTRTSRGLLLGVVFAATTLPAYGQGNSKGAADNKAAPAATATAPQSNPDGASSLTIGKGDLISVAVEGAPDFNKEIRVNPRGEVSLPMVGAVPVAGLTVEQAQEAVAKRLEEGGYFNHPQVSIFEKEYATQGISVLGEVQKPGIYPLFGPHSVLDAISAAGGTTAKAGNKILLTRHGEPNNVETIPMDFKKEQMGQTNVEVHPGDTVVVSKAGIVYVVGDVKQPSGFVMENAHLTVLQAIAMAQGANPTAALGSAKLIRKTEQGNPQEIPIALNKIMAAKAPDLPLQADDIVFVPNSAAKTFAHKSLDAILQTVSGLAVYHPY